MRLSLASVFFICLCFILPFFFFWWIKWRTLWVSLFHYSQMFLEFFEHPLKRFMLTSSLCLNVLFFSFFSRADLRLKAALYGRISLLKCDKEWLWIPEFSFLFLNQFLLFLAFFCQEVDWLSSTLVFPSSSDQFKVISAQSGSQAAKKKERRKGNKNGKGVGLQRDSILWRKR